MKTETLTCVTEGRVLPSVYSDNLLVLDIFFEALNYETIEQKKAYELAGLLGKDAAVECFPVNRYCAKRQMVFI